MAAALPPLKPPENLNKKILTPAKTTLLECKFKTRLILGVVLIPDRSILRMAYGDGGVQEWTNVTFTADKILALSSVMSPDRTVIITQNLKKIVFTDRGANEISNGTCQSVPITKGEEYWFADVLKQNWEN